MTVEVCARVVCLFTRVRIDTGVYARTTRTRTRAAADIHKHRPNTNIAHITQTSDTLK